MAAPVEKTVADMTGVYVMNRTLSGNTDEILYLQGVGFITRKALSIATVTLKINHKTEPDSEIIHIDSVLTGGIKGISEDIFIDDEFHDREDHVWGKFKAKAKRVPVKEIQDEWLSKGWVGEEVIKIESINEANNWTAVQTWGYQDYNGERRYVRHVTLTHKKGVTTCHMVYDYSPLEA
ncbi:hypothetical protein ABW19_dt0200742 [Dactylella cylindrospora]|nr:hypothetical protein ABW19_dt0200742 [Dactylella cylindrospora]